MKTIEVRIEGITPLILHRFTQEAAENATDGTQATLQGDRGTPREQAEAVLYLDLEGEPCIPLTNLFACIVQAGKYKKAGNSKYTTQKSSMIPGFLSLASHDNNVTFKIEHKEPWEVDTRPIRIPKTGGRILRHRPIFNDWALEFVIEYDDELVNPKVVRELVDIAGKRIGLAEYRPDCRGPYGRFVVTLWKNGTNA